MTWRVGVVWVSEVVGGVGGGWVDPFWDGVWGPSRRVDWVSFSEAKRLEGAGLARLHARWDVDPVVALRRVLHPRNLGLSLDALGVVNQWRTVTVEQLGRLTGRSRLGVVSKDGESLVAALFAAGLVEFGLPRWPLARLTSFHPGEVLLRPAQSSVFGRLVAPLLTHPELVRVTGGVDFRQGRQADRHNVLAVELGLRAAELCDVSAVLGELLSSVDLLAFSGLGRVPVAGLQSAADVTLVRSDGLRVALEVTASVGSNFERKVDAWARTLRDTPFESSGLVVVFVDASSPEQADRPGRSVGYYVRKAVQSAGMRFPGSARDRVSDRMFVVSWRDLFPARGVVSDRFVPLTCERPSGLGDRLWERVDVLDAFEFPLPVGVDSGGLLSVVGAARCVAGNPVVCEERFVVEPPDLGGVRCGVSGLVPFPVPVLPGGGVRRRVVGEAWGFAGEVRPLGRLRSGR